MNKRKTNWRETHLSVAPQCRCHRHLMRWVWGLGWVCVYWAQQEGLGEG